MERTMIDWLALSTYTLVMSITPGPNNIMLLASGARFGMRRTLPHLLGVSAGFTAQSVGVCAALGQVAAWLPSVQTWLTWAGVAFLMWMAFKLLRASGPGEAAAGARPLTAIEAILFQLVNPKAWVIAVTTAGVFMPKSGELHVALIGIALVLGLINLPCIAVWAAGGSALRSWLADSFRRTIFNGTMAVLLAVTALGMLRT
jgi:threonine/homoserine/homoserine lactone efflux protein